MSDQTQTTQGLPPTERILRVIAPKKAPSPVPAASMPEDPFRGVYENFGILEPPYDPVFLSSLPEYSDLLPTVLDVWNALVARTGSSLRRWKAPGAEVEPTVSEAMLEDERSRAEELVASMSRYGWAELRERSWTDRHCTGGRYFEVVRDPQRMSDLAERGIPVVLEHIAAPEMRIGVYERQPQMIPIYRRRSTDGQWIRGYRWDYVRRYLRDLGNGTRVWYKQFGDPRHLNRESGEWVSDEKAEELRAKGLLASEIIHDAEYSSRTPYGVSKLAPISLPVLGNREAAEANYGILNAGMRVPFLLLVSGATVSDASIERMEKRLEEKVGQENWHGPVILDAATAGVDPMGLGAPGGGAVKMDVVKLRETFENDAMFLEYIKRNDNRIMHRFRVPPLLVGDSGENYNYATAFASLQMFEDQVAGPARARDDALVNERLFPEHGIQHWVIESRAIPIADYSEIAKVVDTATTGGAISPNEIRSVISRMLRVDLPPKEGEQYDTPIAIQKLDAEARQREGENRQQSAEMIGRAVVEILRASAEKR